MQKYKKNYSIGRYGIKIQRHNQVVVSHINKHTQLQMVSW